MILIWANFNAQSFIHLKLSMKCLELFFYVSTCSQQRWVTISLIGSFSYFLISSSFVRFFRLIAPAALFGHIGAGSLKNSHYLTSSRSVRNEDDQANYYLSISNFRRNES